LRLVNQPRRIGLEASLPGGVVLLD